jgi:hypothetical protein
MLKAVQVVSDETEVILSRLCSFFFPCGEAKARLVRAVKTTEVGEIRMSPEGRWIPFVADQVLYSMRSSFHWRARLDPGKLKSVTVTDAYQESAGRISVKMGGVFTVKKIIGPEVDLGELQRYLAALVLCPPILINHHALEFTATTSHRLRVREQSDPSNATVDFEISEEGCPLSIHAERPRLDGETAVITPWSASAEGFREWDGFRVATGMRVCWHLPDGDFPYYRSEIISFKAIR